MNTSRLRTAWIVKAFSIFFILAPLGNVMLSLRAEHVPGWHDPAVVLRMFGQVVPRDLIWLVGVFLAGVLLWFPRKWSWLWAMLMLAVVTINNLIALGLPETASAYRLIAFAATLGIVSALYFLRYPYLERRDSWWPGQSLKHRRRTADLEIELTDDSGKVRAGRIRNLSITGAMVSVSGSGFRRGQHVTLRSIVGESFTLRAQVRRPAASGLGLQFDGGQDAAIRSLISRLKS